MPVDWDVQCGASSTGCHQLQWFRKRPRGVPRDGVGAVAIPHGAYPRRPNPTGRASATEEGS